jgi:glycosyltransferase involved in cell wall biosynthesis
MATYNGARYIREQLDSFLAQTRRPNELVITDDGSSDETLSIIRDFAASAPFPVRLSQNAHRLDYARNFERAISLCSGDIIFLSDQDDVWFPEKIEKLATYLETHPNVVVVANDLLLTDAALNYSGTTILSNLERIGRDSDGLIAGCATAFRRRWGEELFPMPADADLPIRLRDLTHDQWLHKLSSLLKVRAVLREPLQCYRRTGANTSSWIVSEPRVINARDLALSRMSNAPTDAWRRRLAVLNVYENYLRRHNLAGDPEAAAKALAHERASIERRIALASKPFVVRAGAAWTLWRSGGYRYFEGWLSAVSDLLRSR